MLRMLLTPQNSLGKVGLLDIFFDGGGGGGGGVMIRRTSHGMSHFKIFQLMMGL